MVVYKMYNINNNKTNPIKKATPTMNNELEKITKKVKDRIEREFPDTGYFRDIAEDYVNLDKTITGRAVSLSLERDEKVDGYGRLIIALLHPSKNADLSTTIVRGNRKDILDYMNNPKFSEELDKTLNDLSESMKKY